MTDVFLYAGEASPNDVRLADPTVKRPSGGFPTQYFGLRAFFQSAIKNLCLVALVYAPSGMGGQLRFSKDGITTYAVYLVETNDANASPARIQTTTGTKSIRLKT